MKQYKNLMNGAFAPYYSDEVFTENYGRVPKFRYDTFKYCWDWVKKKKFKLSLNLEPLAVLLMDNFLDATLMIVLSVT